MEVSKGKLSPDHRSGNSSVEGNSADKAGKIATWWSGRKRWLSWTAGGIVIVGGLIFASNQYVGANMVPYYKVYVKGVEVGGILNEQQLKQLYTTKSKQYKDKYPDVEMVLNTSAVTTSTEKAYKADIDSAATLKKLDGMLTAYAKGVEVKVNGQTVGIVKDKATAQAVLKKVQKKYIPAGEGTATGIKGLVRKTSVGSSHASASTKTPKAWLESASIREKIAYEPVKADPNKVLTEEEAVKVLTEGREAPTTYTVQEGDSLSSIATKFNTTAWEIKQNNPGLRELYLQIGDELKVTAPKVPVTVRTVEKVVEQIAIEPEVEIRQSDELKAGVTKVVRPGQAGLKEMDYRLTKENGEVIQEEWLGQKVLQPSVTEVVLRGTKVMGEGSGQFAWPVSGATMSSSFGARWGRMHEGVDLVGSPDIHASDEGVVSFAGQQNGYGNVIMIDHGNGYQTVYGHLSSIGVHVGQVVQQGESIGVMGSTGRSTGTHLHFEIRKDNTARNPMTYLR
ncbi:M23 family metallopeptidase [Paenibacillus polymyxa]|uniref:Membrane protein n=1 Tax=Paenibacillus polymyxa (strain SC2) TaxID=886882 RepID=E3EC16_PAEPS|nr:M23 family metallopeptidase [Paenibacillus polymyxa]ADO59356.1 membrane protein [Paenibacillus polymyxa SC2]AJE51681.1 membrane protein [Paenibacillus polymyxa]MEE4568156.1 M23 family metallopeptidase [Paenibacillus polymyxa]QOH64501.1 M23 family peptidase [Paenibacillus polymyxa]WPQ56905.1 M23 family metallopeptidase [Paenibacillus polymyxa]